MLVDYTVIAQVNNGLAKKAELMHSSILTIDTHTDTPMLFTEDKTIDLGRDNPNTRVDLVKMEKGGLDAVFFAVYMEQGARTEAGYEQVIKKTFAAFESIRQHVYKYKDRAEIVKDPAGIYQAKRNKKKAILIGIENGYAVGKDITLLRKYKELGAAYITLSHTKNNDICDSSTDAPEHNGLSNFGITIVREMNELGLMIDVSHTSDKTVRDVIRFSKAPVIASHSCAKALCNNKRNLNDDLIKLIARNGGVIQVCMVSRFIKPSAAGRATVSDLADHIDHIVKIAGIDYVGLGSDFDGGGGVSGCRDVSQIKAITVELLRRGYTKEQIEKFWSGNFLRVMRNVQQLAIK